MASYSSFNVTPSGAIELRELGVDKKESNKDWRFYWADDISVDHCPTCHTSFGVQTRKHHCRLCGGVFCSNCSANKTPIHCLGYSLPVRVCEPCFYIICYRSLSHSQNFDTQVVSIQGLEQYLKQKMSNKQVVYHSVPPLITLGNSKSHIILQSVASCVHMIAEDMDYHLLLSESGIPEIVMHIIHSSVQQGRFLGTMLKESQEDETIIDSFVCCRKTLSLAVKSLSILSSNEEMKEILASEGRLEILWKLCFADEFVFTEEIHDDLLHTVLEISLHDKVWHQLFLLENGLELPLAIAMTENHDTLQILALSVILKLAQQDKKKRLELIQRGALGVACKLLSEEAKGPQRRVSMQILLELAAEETSHHGLMFQYNVVPPLVKYLLLRPGLKDKNRVMLARILALLGKDPDYQELIKEQILDTLSEVQLNSQQKQQAMFGLHCLDLHGISCKFSFNYSGDVASMKAVAPINEKLRSSQQLALSPK